LLVGGRAQKNSGTGLRKGGGRKENQGTNDADAARVLSLVCRGVAMWNSSWQTEHLWRACDCAISFGWRNLAFLTRICQGMPSRGGSVQSPCNTNLNELLNLSFQIKMR
jgi:hypothetical protein